MEEKRKYDIVEDDVFEPGNHVKLEHTLLTRWYLSVKSRLRPPQM